MGISWMALALLARYASASEAAHGNRSAAHIALLSLYEAAGGPYWKNNSGWDFERSTPCSGSAWFGVECAERDVVSLSFLAEPVFKSILYVTEPNDEHHPIMQALIGTGNNLTGTLPRELFDLPTLTGDLILQFNEGLSGTIPTQVGRLSNMRGYFAIPGGQLSGSLPTEVGLLSHLTEGFAVGTNQLSGTIPDELGRLRRLGHFESTERSRARGAAISFGHNRFRQGVPGSVARLPKVFTVVSCFNTLSWVPLSTYPCP